MPRAHGSRAMSSRPYDRRSPIASLTEQNAPPISPISAPDADPEDQNRDADEDVDVPPDHPGLPTYAEYKRIETSYLYSLSPRKRDKALITQAMFDKIWDVLHQPDACTVDTPQFRFWVRKMFALSRPERDGGPCSGEGRTGGTGTGTTIHPLKDAVADDDLELERSMGIGIRRSTTDEVGFTAVVLHENRPVAIMEQLYELFCYCHVRAGHGGRDKTCAVIREHYSWVPKELTAQFVKACPTCALKRGGQSVIGLDVGVLAHRRVVGRGRGRRGVTPLEVGVEEVSMPSLAWPTTGGPLDPANPGPCGMGEREWLLAARGDMGTVGPPNPAGLSPVLDSKTQIDPVPLGNSMASGWSNTPQGLTLDASPFRLCDMIRSPGHPSAMKSSREERENRSPTKTVTSLPSLASALSDESLDEHVNLTSRHKPSNDADVVAAAECVLPPALRPLRLLGPIGSESGANLQVAAPSAALSPYPFQIDPALLSSNYPGVGLSSSSESGRSDAMLSDLGTVIPSAEATFSASGCLYRPRASSDASMNIPALDPDSPGSSFERAMSSYTTVDGDGDATFNKSPFKLELTPELAARRRCGYGPYDPLEMFYPLNCSVDEVGRQLDAPLSFSIMTDTRCI